jgi:hypothetical protein
MADDEFSAASLPGLGLDAFTRANQLRQFRALNALVADTERGRALAHNATTELIDGWYASCGGVNNAACNACLGPNCANSFVNDFRPAPWGAQPQLYDRVVRPYCRGCHIMQPSFDWSDPAQMTGAFKPFVESRVCTGAGFPNNQRRMPHAEVPFKGFWQSPLAPLQMKAAPLSLPSCER